ncbi:hypothetical protein WR25_25635 [Diploscapter pachys]|uniref:guanylate cyclase n=1 Tax=Diploscapter pachys TaxID=2018661 RepID=A0A2A2KKZ0_9BILA|nr:hypothetical protein WR25_25635 [Diploscapter pachys]
MVGLGNFISVAFVLLLSLNAIVNCDNTTAVTTLNLNDSIIDQNGRIRIKLGHIGAFGALRNDVKILEASKISLHKEGILDDELDVEIISQNGCGESYEGVAVAADMYHLQKVKGFIGPYCNAEMDAVARMAGYWNLPIIGYMAASNALADKSAYPTLARVSVAIVTNTGGLAFDRVYAFEEVFHLRGITVVKKIMFDEFADQKAMQNSGLLQELASAARIIVCLFSNTRETSREFLTAANIQGMPVSEYAYVFPWLQDGGKEISPWTGADGSMLQKVKDQYANAIIIDDVNSFDNTIIQPFTERIKDVGLTEIDVDIANIYGYLYLFDALKLYALAARASLNATGDPKSLLDGRNMWNRMRRLSFKGMVGASGIASGQVTMDDRSERAPLYRGFFVSPNSDTVLPMVDLQPMMLNNCNGLANRSGCYDIIVTDIMRDFWPSLDHRIPKDVPDCGYRGEKCDYTLLFVGGGILFLAIVVALAGYLAHRTFEKRALDKLPFRIYRDDVQFLNEEQIKSMLSLGSVRTKLSNMSYGAKNHAIVGTNTHAIYHKYNQKRPISFNREDKNTLQLMKQAVHDNMNPFLGMVWNEKDELLLVWKFASRGSLQDIIYNENVTLDTKFHGAFIRDILSGLDYLHASNLGYHGSLTPWACLIDRNWMIKLTDYGIADPLERWEKQQMIIRDALSSDEDKSQATQSTSVLYDAPEMLKNREKNRIRRMRRQFGDIYAFGMIMYEIIFRALPFPDDTDIMDLVEQVKDGARIVKPRISENKANFKKGSLVDQMMRMMENYANNLEKLVQERTGMLEEANVRADKLLSQLLPSYVANELKMGRSVPPKTFASATILFSDIVGFTDMCQHATPHEVVTVLNQIFDGFDQFIASKEAYKVETIGDAYMVASGVPQENGHRHINEIACIAIDVHRFLSEYIVPHAPDKKVQCRLGFHTGPVAAAVVGLNAPRYCLFGDTVNMASRMESNGEAGKTQISQEARDLLRAEYPQYIIEERGEIPIKGKGLCTTYWLLESGRKNDAAHRIITGRSGLQSLIGISAAEHLINNLKNPSGIR